MLSAPPPLQAGGGDYEDELKELGTFTTVEEFWQMYAHMRQPDDLGLININLFKKNIKPMWEVRCTRGSGGGLAPRRWKWAGAERKEGMKKERGGKSMCFMPVCVAVCVSASLCVSLS